MPKKSPAGRVVTRTLADGSTRTYHYSAWAPKPRAAPASGSIAALIRAFERSPEYASRAPATRTQYGIYLRPWEAMGHVAVAAVTRRTVLTLRDGIAAGRGHGAATAFGRVSSALFAWAVDRGWREHSPATRIRALPGGHLTAWTAAQADAAEKALPPHLARVVTLARYTGMRRGDLGALTWSAFDGATLRVRQGKAGRSAPTMAIPCHPNLLAALNGWKATRGDAVNVLLNGWGRPWRGQTMSSAMKRGMEAIGMPGLNVHGLRKLAAASLADAGCSTHEIAAITGHRTLAMVELYTRSADQGRMARAAIVKLQLPNKRP